MTDRAFVPSFATAGAPATAADRDCSDFATQAAAQEYFLSVGGPAGDPDRLDADGDGIACESNPVERNRLSLRRESARPLAAAVVPADHPSASVGVDAHRTIRRSECSHRFSHVVRTGDE